MDSFQFKMALFRYPTSSNANEKQANLHRTDELNHASSHQHSGVNESRYTTLSVATPTTQPTYLQTVKKIFNFSRFFKQKIEFLL